MRLALLAVSCLAVLSAPAFAQSEEDVMAQIEALHGNSEAFGEAFAAMQDAFLFDTPTAIADLAAYPLQVAANGELYDILEPADLVDNFDALLTEDTLAALASQDFAALIVTSDGVGFGDGVLWFANVCADDACSSSDWRITRINN
ncbi:MAG TPA: hypothetical protein VL147_20275 [Devosia sp.]|nr:hypothetical protein [Devosia sp.]